MLTVVHVHPAVLSAGLTCCTHLSVDPARPVVLSSHRKPLLLSERSPDNLFIMILCACACLCVCVEVGGGVEGVLHVCMIQGVCVCE